MSELRAGRPSRKDKAIASVQEKEDMSVRMNINLSKEFYKQIKQRALDDDTNITELVKKALNEYMGR